MCCVVEMEDVLVRHYGARLITALDSVESSALSNGIVLFCSLSFGGIDRNRNHVRKLRARGAKVIFYIFDSWNVDSYFYNRNRSLKVKILSGYSAAESCDWIVVPFKSSAAKFHEADRKSVITLPLAVDTTLSNGRNGHRPITVFGYGRQPKVITDALSTLLNGRDDDAIFVHTDHTKITAIHDVHTHRRQFWKTAQMSSIALAYDARVTDPSMFPESIVGQRWFESLAAGCIVVGRRPDTDEADELLGWKDSTIDLPGDPAQACEFIVQLAADKRRLSEIRERNVQHMRERHDWRHRFAVLFDLIKRG
jgi:hypothetical protein